MLSKLSCVQVPREESKADFASQQPWLLITDGENYHIQNNILNNKPIHNCYYDVGGEIPEFHGRVIGCSCEEWVLLYGGYGLPDVLVNLLSKETIELPLMDLQCKFSALTSPPTDPTCHVVYFFEDNEEQEDFLIIWEPGNKEFTIKIWDYKIFPARVCAAVAGKLFLELQESASLAILEFKASRYQFQVVQLDHSEIENLNSWHQQFGVTVEYFFEYSGELFMVYKNMCDSYSSNVVGFTIYQADLLNKKWVRIKNLERLAIFIGSETAHAHSVAVGSGVAANSIYFLEPDDFDSYYVYSLDKGTIRMKPLFCSMETREDTELHWIIMMQGDPSFSKLLKDDRESIRQDSKIEIKSSGEVEQDDEVQESWNMVPPELLNLIQLRLFGRDYAAFGGVCKAWQQASIQDYSLLSSTTFLEQCQSSSPLLMYQEDITSSYDSAPIFRFFDPVHRKLYRTRIPELREANIQYSRDGWLLVSRRSDESIFFINPLTQEKIELPRMRSSPSVDFLSFSSLPTCSDCLVIGMGCLRSTIFTLKHGDKSWREHDIEAEEEYDDIETDEDDDDDIETEEDGTRILSQYNIVVLNGLHYCMCQNRDMVVFNLKNGTKVQYSGSEIWSAKFPRSKSFRGEDFLVEIDGVPALVSVSADGGEICISKWNDVEKDWELMEGGFEFCGKDMFLSKRCSFMEKIDDVGGMGNTIFPPMIDDAKAGVFYSLATRRYHTFCSGYSSELPYIYSGYSSKLPYDVDKFLDGIWVKPDRKVVGHNNLKWFI